MQPSQLRAILNGIEDDSTLLKREGDSTKNMAQGKKGQPSAAKPVSLKAQLGIDSADLTNIFAATARLIDVQIVEIGFNPEYKV